MPLETIEVPLEGADDTLETLAQFMPVIRMAKMLAAYYHGLRVEGIPESVATALTATLQDYLFMQGFASAQTEEEDECSE